MIHYVCREGHQYTIDLFLETMRDKLEDSLSVLTYERIFTRQSVPVGHYVFTDLDRLTAYESEVAARVAEAVRQTEPAALILNHPGRVRERYALLRALHDAGLNSFDAMRIDEGRLPARYPVFLRREADCYGPETRLIQSERQFKAALASLERRRRPVKGWIAVEYRAQPDADGRFRKYGAFRVGPHILPQHVQIADDWIVKRRTTELSSAEVAEENAYVMRNPHASEILRACEIGRIEFGRIDYGIVDGRIEVYEINTNPNFPKADKQDERQGRRALVRDRLVAAFRSLDAPLPPHEPVRFALPRIQVHSLRGPWKLPRPIPET